MGLILWLFRASGFKIGLLTHTYYQLRLASLGFIRNWALDERDGLAVSIIYYRVVDRKILIQHVWHPFHIKEVDGNIVNISISHYHDLAIRSNQFRICPVCS